MPYSENRPKKNRAVHKTIQLIILGAIFAFLVSFIIGHISEVWEVIRGIQIKWVFPLITLFLLSHLVKAVSWARLIQSMGCNLRLSHLLAIWSYSLVGKYIPGSIWMVVGRIYQLRERGVSVKVATYSVSFEQIITLVSGLLVVLVTPEIYQILNLPLWIGLPFIPLTMIIFFPNILGEIVWKSGIRRIDLRLSPGLSLKMMLEFLFENLCAFIIVGIALLILLRLFNVAPSGINIFNASGINAASFVVGYLSLLTPSGIGVREGVFTLLLSQYIPLTQAVIIAFSLRIWIVVADGTGILAAYLYFHFQPKNKFLKNTAGYSNITLRAEASTDDLKIGDYDESN